MINTATSRTPIIVDENVDIIDGRIIADGAVLPYSVIRLNTVSGSDTAFVAPKSIDAVTSSGEVTEIITTATIKIKVKTTFTFNRMQEDGELYFTKRIINCIM